MYIKWFDGVEEKMVQLAENPVKKDLDVLKMLNERYSETLADIDDEIAKVEKELEAMMSELVVL